MGVKPREARRYASGIDVLLSKNRDSLSDEDVELLIELREFHKCQARDEPLKEEGFQPVPISHGIGKILRFLWLVIRIVIWLLVGVDIV